MTKASYTISCASHFRDAVSSLAERRGVNVGDLARSVMLIVPMDDIHSFPDPGEPMADDRETVILKSGTAKGRPWQRKPRLQVRMPAGFGPATIRKALALALAMDRGDTEVRIDDGDLVPAEEVVRLKTIVSALSFEPLPNGVTTVAEALHVLGFPPGYRPEIATLRARFRMLAAIHHPDSGFGDHRRMAQLNSAMDVLRNRAH
jgi:hypothetical protein